MLRFIVYFILLILGYRVLKKFFSPNFGEIKDTSTPNYGPNYRQNQFGSQDDKSPDVEEIDFEEVD